MPTEAPRRGPVSRRLCFSEARLTGAGLAAPQGAIDGSPGAVPSGGVLPAPCPDVTARGQPVRGGRIEGTRIQPVAGGLVAGPPGPWTAPTVPGQARFADATNADTGAVLGFLRGGPGLYGPRMLVGGECCGSPGQLRRRQGVLPSCPGKGT
jgi:hypothetical protein